MKINLLCIGKTDNKEIRTLIDYYTHRLPKHWNFELVEIPDVKNVKNITSEQLKKEEGKLFSNYFEANDYIILLDERGKQ